jgi:hypothetical protein
MGSMLSLDRDDPAAVHLRASARRLAGVAVFSGVVNLLTLAGSLYMLQVYDRVIPSRSVATLLGLSAIVAIAYLLQGYFDALRSRMLARVGALFDAELQPQIYVALISLPLRGTKPILAQQPLRDLDQVRAFLSGTGPTAFLDMPWIPLFLIFHSAIGLTATCGGRRHHRHDIAERISIERRSQGVVRGQCSAAAAGGCFARERASDPRPWHDKPLGGAVVAHERKFHSTQHASDGHPCESRRRSQGIAVRTVIGGSRGRRLSGGDGPGLRRRHDRVCHLDGPRARSG